MTRNPIPTPRSSASISSRSMWPNSDGRSCCDCFRKCGRETYPAGDRQVSKAHTARGRVVPWQADRRCRQKYAFYLFGAALNVFLLLYVLALVVAVVAIILALSRLDVAVVARSFRPAAPVRALGGSLMCIGIGLALVWIAMWAALVFAGRPTPVDPEAFKIVAALDLALMVPALTAGGILLWRRRPWGYVIASQASRARLYLLVLSVNSVIAIRRGLASAPGELPVWGTLLIVTTVIAVVLLANAQQERVISQ